MSGARVRWRPSEDNFEVIGHGVLWFDEDGLIGAADVAAAASLTELRRAIGRYRETMHDVELTLSVYEVGEQLLLEDEGVVGPMDVALEFAHTHTFLTLTLTVDPAIRFN